MTSLLKLKFGTDGSSSNKEYLHKLSELPLFAAFSKCFLI
jgi:hypothetical protein